MSEERPIKTIVIVGGGTAGWVSANFLRARKRSRIIVIEAPGISAVGVGEALTPFFNLFLQTLGYDSLDFIRNVGGSVKLAVRLENWLGRNEVYYHPFQDGGSYLTMPEFGVTPGYNRLISYALLKDIPIHDLSTSYALLCEQFKVPWLPNFKSSREERFGYGSYAYHMDTRKFSETFCARAVHEGVEHVQGDVARVNQHPESGFIESLTLEDGRLIPGDFFVDCTGFRRVLISRMSPEWEPYSTWLPVNRAIPFNVPYRGLGDRNGIRIGPYTLARALSAGWLWRIPLMDRYGVGYVYCDGFISDEEAAAEIDRAVDPTTRSDLRSPIRFDSGTLRQTWIKNCVAVGLASGFIEPLESTSIQITLTQILGVASVLRDPFSFNQRLLSAYNEAIKLETDDIRDFIILHYVTDRDDSAFWRYVKQNKLTMNYPETLRQKLETVRYRTCGHNRVQSEQIRGRVFGELSSAYVLQGLGLFRKESAEADFLQEFETVEEAVRIVGRDVKRLRDHLVQFRRKCLTHAGFLGRLSE